MKHFDPTHRSAVNSPPRISIIVAVLNGIKTIKRCLQSVFRQTYANIELIVMDGNSTDGTQDVLISFSEKITCWESKPDRGIYHGWNKALRRATGEWICFLGADDCLYDFQVLEKASACLSKAIAQGCRLAYGQVEKVDAAGHVVQILGRPWEKISWQIRHGMPIHMPHPGMMHHRSLFEKYGLFDEKFRIAGDYEFLLRELKDPAGKALYLGFPLVKFGVGGISETNGLATLKEARKARIKHGLSPSWLWPLVYIRSAMKRMMNCIFPERPETTAVTAKNKKKLRVGIFTYDFFPWEGGIGRHVYEIQEQLQKYDDIETLVFSPCENDLPNHRRICAVSEKIGKNVLFSIYLNFFIHRLIRKHHLDLVHLQCGSGGIFILKKTGATTIATVHTNSYRFQFRRYGKISKRLLAPLEKQTYQISDRILSVSNYVRNNLIRDYRISPHRIEILPNGVNTRIFHPVPGHARDRNMVLYVGRIYKGKGLEFLIDAMEQVVAKYPEVRLVVAGDGGYLKSIEAYIHNKTVRNHIEFLGWQDTGALNRLYNEAAVCVMPSIVEGFGLTILEAMACGCPVIATDSGGAVDIIRNGENGVLVTYGGRDKLDGSIIQLMTDAETRNQIIENGLKTVRSFTWEAIAHKIYGYYKDEFKTR